MAQVAAYAALALESAYYYREVAALRPMAMHRIFHAFEERHFEPTVNIDQHKLEELAPLR